MQDIDFQEQSTFEQEEGHPAGFPPPGTLVRERPDGNGHVTRRQLVDVMACPDCETPVPITRETEEWVEADDEEMVHHRYGPPQGHCWDCRVNILWEGYGAAQCIDVPRSDSSA